MLSGPTAVVPVNRDPHRGVNMMSIPVVSVKVHAAAAAIQRVEQTLKSLDLRELEAKCGECGSERTHGSATQAVIDAVRELEAIRAKFLKFEDERIV